MLHWKNFKNSDFFVGNNSGPLNLAAALGIKTFGLIATDPVSELKYSKIKPITPENYIDNILQDVLCFYAVLLESKFSFLVNMMDVENKSY